MIENLHQSVFKVISGKTTENSGKQGTCFAIGDNWFLTAAHTLKDKENIIIKANSQEYPCSVIDEISDVALIKANGLDCQSLNISKDLPCIKTGVYSYGFPQIQPSGTNLDFRLMNKRYDKEQSLTLYEVTVDTDEIIKDINQCKGLSGAPLLCNNVVIGVFVRDNAHSTISCIPTVVFGKMLAKASIELFPLRDLESYLNESPINEFVRKEVILFQNYFDSETFCKRPSLEGKGIDCLNRGNSLYLRGSSGTGKTCLAATIIDEYTTQCIWILLREIKEDNLANVFIELSDVINETEYSEGVVVFDDIEIHNIIKSQIVLRKFKTLLAIIAQKNSKIIFTSQQPYVEQWAYKLELTIKEQVLNSLEVQDVKSFLRHYGADDEYVENYNFDFLLLSSLHPQLLHALCLHYSNKGWCEPKGVERDKPVNEEMSIIRHRLIECLTSEELELIQRLSFAYGCFSHEFVKEVIAIEKELAGGANSFFKLIGPWVEKVSENQYRLSPLLKDIGTNDLARSKKTILQKDIVHAVFMAGTLGYYEIHTILILSIKTQDISGIYQFVFSLYQQDEETIISIWKELTWLFPEKRLFKNSVHGDLLLCMFQLHYAYREQVNFDKTLNKFLKLLDDLVAEEGEKTLLFALVMSYVKNKINIQDLPIALIPQYFKLHIVYHSNNSELIPKSIPNYSKIINQGDLEDKPAFGDSLEGDSVYIYENISSIEVLHCLFDYCSKQCFTDQKVLYDGFHWWGVTFFYFRRIIDNDFNKPDCDKTDLLKKLLAIKDIVERSKQTFLQVLMTSMEAYVYEVYYKDNNRALQILEKSSLKEHPMLVTARAEIYMNIDDFRSGFNLYEIINREKFQEIDSGYYYRLYNQGICAVKIKDYKSAVELFKKSRKYVAEDEDYISDDAKIASFMEEVVVYCITKNFDEAIKVLFQICEFLSEPHKVTITMLSMISQFLMTETEIQQGKEYSDVTTLDYIGKFRESIVDKIDLAKLGGDQNPQSLTNSAIWLVTNFERKHIGEFKQSILYLKELAAQSIVIGMRFITSNSLLEYSLENSDFKLAFKYLEIRDTFKKIEETKEDKNNQEVPASFEFEEIEDINSYLIFTLCYLDLCTSIDIDEVFDCSTEVDMQNHVNKQCVIEAVNYLKKRLDLRMERRNEIFDRDWQSNSLLSPLLLKQYHTDALLLVKSTYLVVSAIKNVSLNNQLKLDLLQQLHKLLRQQTRVQVEGYSILVDALKPVNGFNYDNALNICGNYIKLFE